MRQIPINQAKSIIKQLLKAKSQQKISLLTNKIIVNDGEATVEEQGYVNDTNTYSTESTAKHEITRAFKREFPRSHQLYVSYRKDYKR